MEWRKSSFSGNEANCVEIAWHKSSFSGNEANCVELAWSGAGVAVRDSKSPATRIDVPAGALARLLGTVTQS